VVEIHGHRLLGRCRQPRQYRLGNARTLSDPRRALQISETPLDFSRGVLRGGRDLNRNWAKTKTRVGTRTWLLSLGNDSAFLFPSRLLTSPRFP
jgi:hypothetical protein